MMQPHLHKVPFHQQSSLRVSHDVKPNFGNIWHYHPELELHYIIKGEGIRFIGDNISHFKPGEIILLGQNLPHTWRCNQEYFENNISKNAEAIVIQFLPDCLGRSFLNLPEAWLIPRLFEKAGRGLLIKGEDSRHIAGLMEKAVTVNGLGRLVVLMKILEKLAESDESESIATANSFYSKTEGDKNRLNGIYNYTFSNYMNDISLEEIAGQCNLSPQYFCRYFKQLTSKTYQIFLTEVRVSHACRLLAESNKTVENICYESGFNNMTNFFRYFKKLKGIRPSEYREKFLLK